MAMIRPRKDGGCSLCNASDENVGKRRCCHILDNASISVRREKTTNFVDISGQIDNEDSTFSMKANEKTIKSFIASLSNGLSKKDRELVLSSLREM